MKDELKRTIFLKSVAEKYDLYETVLYRELERLQGREAPRYRRAPGPGHPSPPSSPPPAERSVPAEPPPAERDLVRVMLEHGAEAVKFIFGYLAPGDFTHSLTRRAAELLRAAGTGVMDPSALVDQAPDPDLKNFLAGLLSTKYEISRRWAEMGSDPGSADPRKAAEDGIVRMRLAALERTIDEEYRRMGHSGATGGAVPELQQRLITLKREILTLRERGFASLHN